MTVHLLTTGNEVLLGDIVDTNSTFLCQSISGLGLNVTRTVTIGDDIDAMAGILDDMAETAKIGIVTGGLGPTQDDVTAQACAKAFEKKLVLSKAALESMALYFEGRGLTMTPERQKQAMLPETVQVLENKYGTAPGFYIRHKGCILFFLPGVPSEMKPMFENQVVPVLKEIFDLCAAPVLPERIMVFGHGESKVSELLDGFEANFPDLCLGYRIAFPLIEVRLTGSVQDTDTSKASDPPAAARRWVLDPTGGSRDLHQRFEPGPRRSDGCWCCKTRPWLWQSRVPGGLLPA